MRQFLDMARPRLSTLALGARLGFAAVIAFEGGACSGTSHAPPLGGSGDVAGAGGANGTNGAGGGLLFGSAGSGAGTGLADAATCAAEVRKAELLPLDMYVLLDRSESMTEKTASGVTKWGAISTALEAFVHDGASAGLGVGIQYFPLMKPGVPATCTSHAQCGTSGPCLLSACDNQTTVGPCEVDADCGAGHCVGLGECSLSPAGGSRQYCSPIGGTCPTPYGSCVDIPDRPCAHAIDCSSARYATPDVPITTLPAGEAAVVKSIRGTVPSGSTPTAPALEGAVTQAQDWASSHPGHTVVAVLATDGLPTECTPVDIGSVAALAAVGVRGTPMVPTFVIGVFGPADPSSPENLQAIAQAGGTGHAFIVDTSGDVTAEFRKALDSIRTSSLLSCDLALPTSSASGPLDFDRVNLALTDAAEHSTELVYVAGAMGCAASPGVGWYYDVDPKTGVKPSTITLCSDVCSAFRVAVGSRLSLQIGCETVIR